MTRDEIQERIIAFMTEHFELEEGSVKPETRFFEDLGLDSIDAVELVLELGELTDETIEEDDLRKIVTISDIVDLVVKLQAAEEAKKAAAANGESTDAPSDDVKKPIAPTDAPAEEATASEDAGG